MRYSSPCTTTTTAIGAYSDVETGTMAAGWIAPDRWLAPEQAIITSSCGFSHLPDHVAPGKMPAMTETKAILTGSRT